MALTNLQVFSAAVQGTATETLSQQIDLFNAATRGGIVLKSSTTNEGDFADKSFWQIIAGLVRRRDAYATGAVTPKYLVQLLETSVKVDAGTPPLQIDPHWMQRINKNPAEAGAVIGKQMAEQRLQDYLEVALSALAASIGAIAAVTTTPGAALTLGSLNTGASKMGDRASEIACWVMHSKSLFDLLGAAITNSANLFTFGTVNIKADPMGRPIVVTDSLSLYLDAATDLYYTLGLTPGAAIVEENNDFLDAFTTATGDESIRQQYQAQWSYNVAIKGHQWDKTNGGKSPTTAALATASNWDKVISNNKDGPGVIIKAQ